MKMKKATVVSSYAIRGIGEDLKDSKNILIAQNDNEFSQKIVLALTDKKLNRYIGKNASIVIKKHYSFNKFKKIIQEVID